MYLVARFNAGCTKSFLPGSLPLNTKSSLYLDRNDLVPLSLIHSYVDRNDLVQTALNLATKNIGDI